MQKIFINDFNFVPTKKVFHSFLNPERKVSESAFKVHGYTDEFLSRQKKFIDIAQDFLNFIDKNYQLPPSSLSFETNIRHTKKKDENIHLEEKRSIWREKSL